MLPFVALSNKGLEIKRQDYSCNVEAKAEWQTEIAFFEDECPFLARDNPLLLMPSVLVSLLLFA